MPGDVENFVKKTQTQSKLGRFKAMYSLQMLTTGMEIPVKYSIELT